MHWLLLSVVVPYVYLIFRIHFALSKIKTFSPEAVPGRFVSVVVACRNEQKNLPTAPV